MPAECPAAYTGVATASETASKLLRLLTTAKPPAASPTPTIVSGKTDLRRMAASAQIALTG